MRSGKRRSIGWWLALAIAAFAAFAAPAFATAVFGQTEPTAQAADAAGARWLTDAQQPGQWPPQDFTFTAPVAGPDWAFPSSQPDGGLSSHPRSPELVVSPSPEPATLAFLSLGSAVMIGGAICRRRRRNAAGRRLGPD